MKKCGFLSPETLLQAEIFGDGNGGGSSNIVNAFDWFLIYTANSSTGDGDDQLIAGHAYYNNAQQIGVYYFEFEATGTSPEIQINSDVVGDGYTFFDFVSNNDTATQSLQEISFTATIGEHIAIGGTFGYSSR